VPTYIALLRGINVGGGKKVPMAALKGAFEDFGAEHVQTYIQSGNVVFTHAAKSEATLVADVEAMIAAHTGFTVDVMLRTAAQMKAVVAKNPYPDATGTALHVLFFAANVDKAALAKLDLDRFAPEEASAVGRELYLFLPNGMGRAKLPPVLSKLKVPTTARNWNSVTKLLAMAQATK
jgi:uncharacterized protein (DUF1697 family)